MAIINYNTNFNLTVYDKEKNYADRDLNYELKIFGIKVWKKRHTSKEDISKDCNKPQRTGF
jgi:hypothetical protein